MKLWQYLTVLGTIFLVGVILALQIPQLYTILVSLTSFLVDLAVFIVVLASPAVLGWLGKAYGIPLLDIKIWEDENMTDLQRHGILTVLIFTVFFGWIGVAMATIREGSWLYQIGTEFGWIGVFETPPIWWGVWAVISFWLVWALVDHEPNYRLFS